MLTYFQRDKLDRLVSFTIHIIEQAGRHPFNRGKLCNVGYVLAAPQADYICFHDVDYLPIWSDYAYPDNPTHLIWHGLHRICQYPNFFGAVTLFNNADFERTNGFSNHYWGWGEEDEELRERCRIQHLKISRNKGTYQGLPHEHQGYHKDGTPKASAIQNKRKSKDRLANLHNLYTDDGLSSLRFENLERAQYNLNGTLLDHVYHHKVDIFDPE